VSATVRAAAALLDASYQIEDKVKADTWREIAVEARREYDQLRAECDEAQANYRFMVERAADEKLDGYRELGARAAAAENERDEALAVIRLILEADCLRSHAFERGDDDASVYDLCRQLLGKA